ncbi:hypothetical protein [Negadavirga shengliensis]|uniref:Uncharacterized protein n=1 Tax=Negadavirga shengliensis TaxID=1389218 RepID=A0ABV9T725_9BACT
MGNCRELAPSTKSGAHRRKSGTSSIMKPGPLSKGGLGSRIRKAGEMYRMADGVAPKTVHALYHPTYVG